MFGMSPLVSWAIRIVAGLLVIGGIWTHGYVKGIGHEQDKQDLIAAKQADAAMELAAKHATASSAVLADREVERNETLRTNPDVAAVIAAGRVCAPVESYRKGVPAITPDSPATRLRSSTGSSGPLPSGYDCTQDVQTYRTLIVDYRKFRALWHANEAKP